ncbi:MAG: shikimate kinase [Maricaulaceae bacterium]|nr:shikimate kinase [Maricaulaceae bacterium]
MASAARTPTEPASALRSGRTIVLVGLMGAGKSTVGKRLAKALNLPFRDADAEIEKAAGRSVADIFADFGEAAFRDGERKVITRLLDAPEPMVLALGGGAFADPATRALVKDRAVSVWLKADLDTLMARVSRRRTRPLLNTDDPRAVMAELMEKRESAYAEADIHVEAGRGPHDETVTAILAALEAGAP